MLKCSMESSVEVFHGEFWCLREGAGPVCGQLEGGKEGKEAPAHMGQEQQGAEIA